LQLNYETLSSFAFIKLRRYIEVVDITQRLDFSNYQLVRHLGRGAFGEVSEYKVSSFIYCPQTMLVSVYQGLTLVHFSA